MRMWMVNPKFLCINHLLGEHGEIHKFRHTFVKKYKLGKRIQPIVQIEPSSMKKRHDELAEEIIRRGGNHKSPYEMPDLSHLTEFEKNVKVDIEYNINDLKQRCVHCNEIISIFEREL